MTVIMAAGSQELGHGFPTQAHLETWWMKVGWKVSIVSCRHRLQQELKRILPRIMLRFRVVDFPPRIAHLMVGYLRWPGGCYGGIKIMLCLDPHDPPHEANSNSQSGPYGHNGSKHSSAGIAVHRTSLANGAVPFFQELCWGMGVLFLRTAAILASLCTRSMDHR